VTPASRARQGRQATEKAAQSPEQAEAARRLEERLAAEAAGRPVVTLDPTPYPDPPDLEDPLADLRQDTDPGTPSEAAPEPEAFIPGALVTEEQQTLARHTLLAAWHADPTTLGFLHRGEVCGCWYISGVTVGAVLPVQANDEGAEE
jgi:hypothetical protein